MVEKGNRHTPPSENDMPLNTPPSGARPRARDRRSLARRLELPTWALAVTVYGGWGLLTWHAAALPWWLLLPAGAWIIAWHMSLQHEVIHGHPTRNRRINDAIGFPPLSLWLPYAVYRESHLAHHRDQHLTDPLEDPESRYLTAEQWAAMGPGRRALTRANATLAGRVTLGPAFAIGGFLKDQAARLADRDRPVWRVWLTHGAGAVAVVGWVSGVCGLPLWEYALLFVYPGCGLALVRSFAEHRAADRVEHRTAIVEQAAVLGLLFLNNNLHVVHHQRPGLPWYEIPAAYRRHRESLIAGNGGLVYRGYAEVAARFLFTPHDELLHPKHRSRTIASIGGNLAQEPENPDAPIVVAG